MSIKHLAFAALLPGLCCAVSAQQVSTGPVPAPPPPAEFLAGPQPEMPGAEKDPSLLKKLRDLKEQVLTDRAKSHARAYAKKHAHTPDDARAFRNKAVRFLGEMNNIMPGRPDIPLINDERFAVHQFICARPRVAARILTAEMEIARSTEAYGYRAQARSLYGDLAGAEEDLSAAIKISPQGELLAQRGHLYLRQRKYDQAIADFTRAIKAGAPAPAYHARAAAYFAKDDYAGAAEDLGQFFKLNTDRDFAASISRSKICKSLRRHGFSVEGCAAEAREAQK